MKEIHRMSQILKQPSINEIELRKLQVVLLTKANLNQDLSILVILLHEKFTYFDSKSKWPTLKYFKDQIEREILYELKTDEVSKYFFRVCQHGNHSLKLHCDHFHILTDEENISKTLMLSFKEDFILDFILCYEYYDAEQLQEIAIQTKCLRKGFYLRCASQRASQCDCIIVNYFELNDYFLVVNNFQFTINVFNYCFIVFYLLIILIFLFNF